MRPTSFPKRWNNESSKPRENSRMATQLWRTNGRCPKNSIPIRRTTREDILRAKSLESYGKKYPNGFSKSKQSKSTNINLTHEYSVLETRGRFRGGKAIINLWKPHVQTQNEFSLAQLWLSAEDFCYPNKDNIIEAGWQVYMSKYGDYKPRFFVYWTVDRYRRTGCYNLDCPGFVTTNQHFAIGASLGPVSRINGEQYHIPTSVWKDSRSGHWLLKVYDNTYVGYWPKSLFTHLLERATVVQWGGEVLIPKDDLQHTTTKMGSGYFAEEGYQKASYFKNVAIVDEGEYTKSPDGTFTFMTEERCYNIRANTDPQWGLYFFYGGPGRNPNCA
ncbi:unnamed protein product [Cochlearia groenlandica]